MLIHGLLRDYVSNGIARMEMYLLLRQVFSIQKKIVRVSN